MEDKKKILFVITKGKFGGAQRYVYDLATNLPKEHFEAAVVGGIKEGNLLQQKLSETNIKTIDLENSERDINLKKDWLTLKDLIRVAKVERPDIVHFNSSKIGLIGSLAVSYLKIRGWQIKTVFTSHGWAFNEQNRNWLEKIIFYTGHFLTVLICDKTIAVSEKTKQDIVWLPFIEKKVKVIYNGLIPFKKFSRHRALETFKKDPGQTVVFTISELHPNKGLDVAFKALSILPQKIKAQVKYYIAGDGEERERLQNLARELGLLKTVYFLGFVEEAKRLLSGADIFLFPSKTENMPFAILEAGLAGLPIIATSVGGVPEIIKDMYNGILIHRNNPKEIAEALMYLLEHKDKKREFGQEVHKTVTNFFSLERMLRETTKIYQSI